MTFFDNLKNKLFKEETSGKGQESQPAVKSKDLQDKIKGLFAKKPTVRTSTATMIKRIFPI